MKFSKKLVAIAVLAVAASGAAQARIVAPGDTDAGGSEFIFNLVNYTKQNSYTLDLGLTTEQFRANPSQTYNFDANNADLQSFLSVYSASDNVTWGVFGGHSLLNDPSDTLKYGLYTTSAVGTPTNFDANAGDISNSMGVVNDLISYIQTTDGVNSNNFSTFRTVGQMGYTQPYGNDLMTALPFIAQGNVGESLAFVHEKVNDSDFDTGEVEVFAGNWNFAINGGVATLAYSAAPVVATPLPAAVWMFGAGLMGVLRLNRRKSNAI